MQVARVLIHASKERISTSFSPIRRRNSDEKEKRHRRPYCPAMPLAAGHTAECVCETRRNRENQYHLEEVREGSGILEWMGAIGAKKSTAIGAEFLDDFLRRHGALCDDLLR